MAKASPGDIDFNYSGGIDEQGSQDIDISQVDTQTDEIQRAENTLPGKEDKEKTINWLGSSYSGVDIKVVAHLYGSVERNEEVSYWKDRYDYTVQMKDAFEYLKGTLTSLVTLTNIRLRKPGIAIR